MFASPWLVWAVWAVCSLQTRAFLKMARHALAMERKDAEVAHLKAHAVCAWHGYAWRFCWKVRLAALEARSSVFAESWTSAFGQGHLAPQDAVATAVQTKASWRSEHAAFAGKFRASCQDEECALMMAAKHKETRSRRGGQSFAYAAQELELLVVASVLELPWPC